MFLLRQAMGRATFLVCWGLVSLVTNAVATVRDEPVEFLIKFESAGQQPAWTIEARVGRAGTLTALRAHGDGLVVDTSRMPALQFNAMTPARFEVKGQGLQPSPRIVIEYDFDGLSYSETLLLPTAEQVVSTGTLVPVAAASTGDTRSPAPDVNPSIQQKTLKGRLHEPRQQAPENAGEAPAASRDITVHGRVVYQRPDGVFIGADNARVEIYDADITFDQLKATTASDANGYYSATFNWDPCPIVCEQNPDIYIRVESSNGAATVESANLEITYSWESGVTEDYTGTNLDLGNFQPSSDQQALQLLTNITRGWRWLSTRGYNTASVEVKWPANSISATYYNPTFETIHILSEDDWDEVTHVHEYGHHWTNTFGSFSIPTYTDLHCGIFGHCMWCSENDVAAFIEGWADWLSDIIVKSFSPSSTTTDDAEVLHQCGEDGFYNSAYTTEGFFAALLRDIEDNGNEDDPAFSADGFRDVLSLGTDEILAVADQDAPLTPSAFLSSFKARYPSVTCELWETGRNNGYDLDSQSPGLASGLDDESAGGPLMCAQPTGERNITWIAATDDWSCVSGYSVSISTSPQLPDAVQDIGALTERKTGCLSSGDYYFNIRTRDRSGKWSTGFASHPFNISAGYASFPATSRHNTWTLFATLIAIGAGAILVRRRLKSESA